MPKQKPTNQLLSEEERIRTHFLHGGLFGTDVFPTRERLINTAHWCHFCVWRDVDICRAQAATIANEIIGVCQQAGGMRTFPPGFPHGERHYKRDRREVDGDDGDNPSYPDHPSW